jgi:hypothetical protein
MQKIEIKKGELGIAPNTVEKTTIDLIRDCLNIPPQGGFTLQDYKKRNRIERAVETLLREAEISGMTSMEGTFLLLEDNDYETLKHIVKIGPFAIRQPFLTDFVLSFE